MKILQTVPTVDRNPTITKFRQELLQRTDVLGQPVNRSSSAFGSLENRNRHNY